MNPFFDRLQNRMEEISSLLCVGLDPHPEDLPDYTGEAAGDFCLSLIEQTLDWAAAYKPNAAFFEAMGPSGWENLGRVIEAIPKGIPVILDVKRGDISSTARAYVRSAFQELGGDAVTINPYLGRGAVWPFLEDESKGAFLLCKTSNPGASDLQDLWVSLSGPGSAGERPGRPLYLQVAALAREWNQNRNLGLVVGATQVPSLQAVRAAAPDLWLLAPGVGAQGGNLGAALKSGLNAEGYGMIIPVSRGISRAENPGRAARTLRDEINRHRERILVTEHQSGFQAGRAPAAEEGLAPEKARLAEDLFHLGCVRLGDFTLKSGAKSPIYIDLRRLIAYPQVMRTVAQAYLRVLNELDYDHLAGLPYAALPIASAISLLGEQSLIYPRKETKDYGTKAAVEGVFEAGDRAVIIDDLITTGGSKLEGIEKLTSHDLSVKDIVVLIDRSRDAGVELAEHGYQLHAVVTLKELILHYRSQGLISSTQAATVHDYLSSARDSG